ncbi:hypothetical protein CSC3H3_04950 [Thalassospira marina]|uniref:Uncharacterized protein n=1 Tax=Thalassospira marina TaxID=2048283 RepID=A0ABN5FH23_9PROT|nr:hypothetical protein CSC3H3_04950 [Thalassospira marina]
MPAGIIAPNYNNRAAAAFASTTKSTAQRPLSFSRSDDKVTNRAVCGVQSGKSGLPEGFECAFIHARTSIAAPDRHNIALSITLYPVMFSGFRALHPHGIVIGKARPGQKICPIFTKIMRQIGSLNSRPARPIK